MALISLPSMLTTRSRNFSTLFLSKSSSVSADHCHSAKFCCEAKLDNNKGSNDFNRRDFLALTLSTSAVIPDYFNCIEGTKPDGTPINCCPPIPLEITDYSMPSATGVTRVRAAAQSDNGAKFARAIELMRQLPSTDPRSFTQQANVHCAYCGGGHNQKGFPNLELDVHRSWLFLPFHRWYIYFFERICAKLIQDDTFALPFWNWDSPSGMQIPHMFTVPSSPLYDALRNRAHLPPAVVDLDWNLVETTLTPETQIKYNLSVIYRSMLTNATTPDLFMGQPFRAGDDITTAALGPGSLEEAPHNTVHIWTGDPEQPNGENMGTFYSAARDPIFYAHHANIDRMWSIWVNKLGGQLFGDTAWLDSAFVFHNEDAKPVLVRVKDCLDPTKLGYTYEEVELPWLNSRPSLRRKGMWVPPAVPEVAFPKALEETLAIMVKRVEREMREEEGEEVLVIDVDYECCQGVKFDVFINEDDVEACTPENSEFVGSFINVPHGQPKVVKESCKLAIGSVLEEIEDNESDDLLVTLVPKYGTGVSIGGVKIEFDLSEDSP